MGWLVEVLRVSLRIYGCAILRVVGTLANPVLWWWLPHTYIMIKPQLIQDQYQLSPNSFMAHFTFLDPWGPFLLVYHVKGYVWLVAQGCWRSAWNCVYLSAFNNAYCVIWGLCTYMSWLSFKLICGFSTCPCGYG